MIKSCRSFAHATKTELSLHMLNIPGSPESKLERKDFSQHSSHEDMMALLNGNVFRVTGSLWGEFTGHRWIPLTKASEADLWCFFFHLRLNKRLCKQSRRWWFETPSCSLWRYCDDVCKTCPVKNIDFGGRRHVQTHRGHHWVIMVSVYGLCLNHARKMMTLSNGSIFRVTGPLRGEFTGHRWIPRTKASDAELWLFLWSAPWINGWVNNREAGDLTPIAHYDVIVMIIVICTMINKFKHKTFLLRKCTWKCRLQNKTHFVQALNLEALVW